MTTASSLGILKGLRIAERRLAGYFYLFSLTGCRSRSSGRTDSKQPLPLLYLSICKSGRPPQTLARSNYLQISQCLPSPRYRAGGPLGRHRCGNCETPILFPIGMWIPEILVDKATGLPAAMCPGTARPTGQAGAGARWMGWGGTAVFFIIIICPGDER